MMLRLIGAALLASLVTTEVTADPYPLDYWARRPAISGVSLSPNGSQFALTRILERGGNPIIELYDSDNLGKDPIRIDSSPMEIMPGIRWIDDEVFLFTARQQVRDQIEGFNQGVYEYQNVKYDGSKKNPIGRIRQDYFSVEGLLPDKDNKILISIIDKFNGGPVGITTLATAVSENAETIEEVYEPFLIQQGFIVRTPRGREVTMRAYKHLGRIKNSQGGLF